MNPWAIIDACTIVKGEGHYDFDTLIQQLIGMTGGNGLEAMPRPMDDIGGGDLSGVQTDAIYEAIYQGAVDATTAAIIVAGPQMGQEGLYQQAVQRAIAAGAPTINQAVDFQNKIWESKRAELINTGKDPSKIPEALPLPFETDMGSIVVNGEWANGVWGKQNKDSPWEYDQYGQRKLRIGNRDQENKFAESWNRPYHEGLQQVRGGGKTSESIQSHRVQPNSVFITHEAGKHIYDMMDTLSRQGYNRDNLTPEMVKQFWAAHPVLAQYMPQNRIALNRIYGIRNTNPHTPQEADAAQAAVEQQNPMNRASDYANWLPEDGLTTARGVNLMDRARDNYGHYGSKLFQAYQSHYDLPEDFTQQDAERMGQGRRREDRLVDGIIRFIEQRNPGIVPEHIQDASVLRRPTMNQAEQRRPDPPQPEAPPQPAQPAPPPVPVEPLAPPPPVQQEAPAPHPPVQQEAPAPPPPQRPPAQARPPPQPRGIQSLDSPAPTPEQQAGLNPDYLPGWRGMSERLADALGRGGSRFMSLFGKSDIDDALESVQKEMALNNSTIQNALPNIQLSSHNPEHISLFASQYNIAPTKVATALNSRGHWEEISKSMDMDYELFQLTKVAFE